MDKKYEALIEHILNDETDKARELFHDIVVNKSREIYENIMDMEDDSDIEEIGDDIDIEQVGEADDMDMDMDMDDTMPSDDQADDMMTDVAMDADDSGMDDMDDEDAEADEELEDRVMDLEDALDDLKREFEELMADEEAEEDEEADDSEAEAEDEFTGDEAEAEDEMKETSNLQQTAKLAADFMREYIEKVAAPANTEGQGVADAGKVAAVNTKSIVAGKNDMGGSTKNIARGGSNTAPDGNSAPSSEKPDHLPHAGKFQNVPGARAGKSMSGAKKPTTSEPGGVNDNSIIDGK
jgi:hypothetical protein